MALALGGCEPVSKLVGTFFLPRLSLSLSLSRGRAPATEKLLSRRTHRHSGEKEKGN